jgi:Anti-sigma-K factor rskA
MTGSEHISHEDLALQALQALPEGESEAVRAHLVQCAVCRDVLAELSGDAAMIGLGVPQYPVPAGARDRFLNRIDADATASKQSLKQEIRGRILPFFWNTWIPWVPAAALAILAISLFVKNGALNRELVVDSRRIADLSDQSAQARRILDVLTSRSAQRVLLTAGKTAVEPTGRAFYLAESGGLVFQANNLKMLASDKTYELWLIPVNGKPIPAGLFRPDATGSASILMPPLPKGVPAKAFGVTIEKAEGADTPTAPIIISGAPASNAGE